MSEVNYRRNGLKYSSGGKCWGLPKTGRGEEAKADAPKPKSKSSRERRALKKGR